MSYITKRAVDRNFGIVRNVYSDTGAFMGTLARHPGDVFFIPAVDQDRVGKLSTQINASVKEQDIDQAITTVTTLLDRVGRGRGRPRKNA